MKNFAQKIHLLILSAFLLGVRFNAFAQGTAFTYQGQLSNNGNLADGLYDFRFRLFTDALGNSPEVGSPYVTNAIAVSKGLFTTTVNFGVGVFTGTNYFLEVDVRTNNPANNLGYTALSPNQDLTPVPYASFAASAGNLSGTIPATQITGAVGSTNFSGTYGSVVSLTNAGNLLAGSFSGNGSAVSNVNATALNGLTATSLWQTGGNEGTTPVSNYLGTTDNQPLELHVNGARALRLEPGVAGVGAPNVIGGASINYISPGVIGSVIGGGGATNYAGVAFSNSLFDVFCVIGGGALNSIQSNSFGSVIGGGSYNTIQSNAYGSTIAGGGLNIIWASNFDSTIGGGYQNTILSNAWQSTIAGGNSNSIQNGANNSTIGGGFKNLIMTNGYQSTIGGGFANVIQSNAYSSVIGGGVQNTLQTNAYESTISGGYQNSIQSNAYQATIAGGYQNVIAAGAYSSAIGGGNQNTIRSNASFCTIGGGNGNTIEAVAGVATIAGGSGNHIFQNDYDATISGGAGNTIQSNAPYSNISGGLGNAIQTTDYASAIGGGEQNSILSNSSYSTIPGGFNNIAAGNGSFAAGTSANALNNNCFVWSDGTITTTSTANNQFMVRASGGTIIYSGSGNSGVSLAAGGGSWSNLSDRNAKEHFLPASSQEVLAKLSALPISKWNYKTEQGVTHIGPMAQDFYAAFAVGEDERHISTVDEEGVALAAIQGLNQKLEEKMAAIHQQDVELANLKERLEKLERVLSQNK